MLIPDEVCSRTGAMFDCDAKVYSLSLFNESVTVSLDSREIGGSSPKVEKLLTGLSYFSHLSILGYLVHGSDAPPSGKLVKPGEMPGVDAMVRGSHTLPLDALSARYGDNAGDFMLRGESWGGIPESYGDASVRLYPFKNLPVILILWTGDEEFPARSSLLLDAASRSQAPADILWSVMMMTVLLML